jgi:aldose sugar dehydrogenase
VIHNIALISFLLIVLGNFALVSIFSCLINAQSQNSVPLPGGMFVSGQFYVSPSITDPLLKAELVFKGLHFPTGMAFLGPGDVLVTEKNDGTVRRIVNGNMLPQPLLDVNVANKNERGMLGIAISKHEKEPTYIFLYYTESQTKDGEDIKDGKEPLGYRLYRYQLNDNRLINAKLLLDIKPDTDTVDSGYNNGGKILIGPDGNIYVSIGDLGNRQTKSQNFKNGSNADGTGGILRLTQDGKPVGKGILGDTFPLDLYYAHGIRNSFGMDFDPVTKKLWDTENGPAYGDEINLVEPGFNSGWRIVQGMSNTSRSNLDSLVKYPGLHYNEKGLLGIIEKLILEIQNKGYGRYSDPEFVWTEPIGITAIKFLDSNKLGVQYQNDIFVGDLQNGNLYEFKLNKQRTQILLSDPNSHLNDKIAKNRAEYAEVVFATGFGSIRDIQIGPDGYMYILTYDKTQAAIFRIVPVDLK